MMPPFEEALQRLLDDYSNIADADEIISALELAFLAAMEQQDVD